MDDGRTRTIELGAKDGTPVWITTTLAANPSDPVQKTEQVRALDGDLLSRSIENSDGSITAFTYDAMGGKTITLTDVPDVKGWQTYERGYDASGALTSLSVLGDNGLETDWTYESGVATKRVQTDLSDGNDFGFDSRTTLMDSSGAPERMIINQDGGTTVVVDYGLSGRTVSHIRLDALHYDNAGADTGEFVQIRVTSGFDISGMAVELLDGIDGTVYDSATDTDLSLHSSDGGFDYYRWEPATILDTTGGVVVGLNGVALTPFSYEGSFDVQQGLAAGTTTTAIDVYQDGTGTSDDVLTRDRGGVWEGGPDLLAPVATDDVIAMSDGPLSSSHSGSLFSDNGNGRDQPGLLDYTGNVITDGSITVVAINGVQIPAGRDVAISTVDGSFSGTMEVNADGSFRFNELNETLPGGLIYEFEFTYTIENTFGAQDTATANVTYTTINNPPFYTGPDDLLIHETAEPVPVFQLTQSTFPYFSLYDHELETVNEVVISSLPANGTIVDGNGVAVSVNDSFGLADLADIFDLRFVPDDVTGNVDSTFAFRLTDENGGTQIQTLDIRVTDDLNAAGNIWDLVAGGSGDETLPPAGETGGFRIFAQYGSAGQDTLTAETFSSEVFDGGSGDDTIVLAAEGSGFGGTSGAPADVLIFRDGTGTDTVINALAGSTIFDLQAFDFTSKQDVLDAATQVGDDLHIALDLDDTIILQDRDISFFDTATTITFADVLENGGIDYGQLLLAADLDGELIDAPIIIE